MPPEAYCTVCNHYFYAKGHYKAGNEPECPYCAEAEKKKSILLEAEQLIHGDRNKTYGDAGEDYTRTVDLFKALYGDLKVSELTATHGMMFMVCVKLSREAHLHKRDNLLDAAGYLALIEENS